MFALSSPSVLKNNDGFGNGAPPHLGGQKKNFLPLRGKKKSNLNLSVLFVLIGRNTLYSPVLRFVAQACRVMYGRSSTGRRCFQGDIISLTLSQYWAWLLSFKQVFECWLWTTSASQVWYGSYTFIERYHFRGVAASAKEPEKRVIASRIYPWQIFQCHVYAVRSACFFMIKLLAPLKQTVMLWKILTSTRF